MLAAAKAHAGWWSRLGLPASHDKAKEGPLAGVRDFLAHVWRPETPGERHAVWQCAGEQNKPLYRCRNTVCRDCALCALYYLMTAPFHGSIIIYSDNVQGYS